MHAVSFTEADGSRRTVRFLRAPKGVLPVILETLLRERRATRARITHKRAARDAQPPQASGGRGPSRRTLMLSPRVRSCASGRASAAL